MKDNRKLRITPKIRAIYAQLKAATNQTEIAALSWRCTARSVYTRGTTSCLVWLWNICRRPLCHEPPRRGPNLSFLAGIVVLAGLGFALLIASRLATLALI